MSEPQQPQMDVPADVVSKTIPDWASAPLKACLEYLGDEAAVYRATIDGLGYTSSVYEVAEGLRDLSASVGNQSNISADDIERYRTHAAAAKAILADKQDMLAAHALIGFWAAAEVFAEDLTVAFLAHDSTLLLSEGIGDVKVPFRDFENLGKEDRIRAVLPLIQRRQSREEAPFESQLDLVGLSGPIPAPTRTAMREAWQLRNVILHRRGIADARLVALCPQLNYQIGNKVQIGPDHRYLDAILGYVILVGQRLEAKFSVLPISATDNSE